MGAQMLKCLRDFAWVILFGLVIFALITLMRADDTEIPKDPKSITIENREKIKDLWIKAIYKIAEKTEFDRRVEEAKKAQAVAELAILKKQKELDEINDQITSITKEYRLAYGADEEKWCLSNKLAWIPKVEKECPVFSVPQ
jgi:hypothetical protein